MAINRGYRNMNKTNLPQHGTVGGILIGIKLKKVLMQVASI